MPGSPLPLRERDRERGQFTAALSGSTSRDGRDLVVVVGVAPDLEARIPVRHRLVGELGVVVGHLQPQPLARLDHERHRQQRHAQLVRLVRARPSPASGARGTAASRSTCCASRRGARRAASPGSPCGRAARAAPAPPPGIFTITSKSRWSVEACSTKCPSPVNSRSAAKGSDVKVFTRAVWSGTPFWSKVEVPAIHIGSG